MSHRSLFRSSLPLTLALLLAAPMAVPARAGDRAGKGQSAIDLSLPLSLLGSMGGTMTISCDTDVDTQTRAAMRALSTQGASGRFAWTDDDGSRLVAQRDGGRFRLRVTDEDDKTVSLEMPWGVAQCLLSGSKIGPRRMSLASLQRNGGFSLKVNGEETSFHVQVK
jgi:hypothetical protein